MDQAITQIVVAGLIELIMVPLLLFALKHALEKRLNAFDEKREEARAERAENERKKIEQREAERGIVLAMARTMLLNNYEKCMEKGYYTVEERDVYSALLKSYLADGGNGVIADLGPRIRALPVEPPDDHHESHK